MAENEQQLQGRTSETGLRFVGGSINLGNLGLIIYSAVNPTEIALDIIAGVQEITLGDPVIQRYLDEHPEEVTEQQPTLSRLSHQIFRQRLLQP